MFAELMKKIKGPLSILHFHIQMEIDDCEEIIRARKQRQINLAFNITLGYRNNDILREFNENKQTIKYWENQLKVLKETEIIISAA